MSDSLDLLLNRNKPPGPAAEPAGADGPGADEESCPAFGYARGIRDRAWSIEFRFATGDSRAFPYSWLGPVVYNPSAGLLLKFVGDLVYLVLIEGSNLNAPIGGAVSLYDRGILRQRVSWVREMTPQQGREARPGDVVVDRIRTVTHRADEEPKGTPWLEPFGIG